MRNSVYRPVVSLIIPFQPTRFLETPFQAFRFVSLIPLERLESLGGKRVERWHSFHTFLSRGAGDVEDHCALLCSLFLGFGLDAYVAVGTAVEESHCWVITRVGKSGSPIKTTTFWETITGQRMESDDPRVAKFYKTISCVFTEGKYYANIQADDRVPNTLYDFENELHWKSMNPDAMKNITIWNFPVQLTPPTLNLNDCAEKIERELKDKINDYRMSIFTMFLLVFRRNACINTI